MSPKHVSDSPKLPATYEPLVINDYSQRFPAGNRLFDGSLPEAIRASVERLHERDPEFDLPLYALPSPYVTHLVFINEKTPR